MVEESLKTKTIKGVGWSFVDNILGQGVSFLVSLVLARLLSPTEYGLIGVITIFINVSNAIVDSGLSSAIIRKKTVTDIEYNTMFIVNMLFSISLYIILYLFAPFISVFFKAASLLDLTRVMGLVVIFNALSIVQNTIITRQLDFKTRTKASLISSIVSGFIGIAMAIGGLGVWALVGQQILRQLLNSVCLWIYTKWLPAIKFSVEKFKDMWGFGWKILISGILYSIWCELTQVVIGRYYSTTTLGLYTRANQFSCIFSTNLTSVVQRVSYPALSQLKDEKDNLKANYKKVIKVTMFVSFVCMMGMAACSRTIISLLLGGKWMACVPLLRLICLSMMFYPLNAINLNLLQIQGRSDLYLRIEILKKFVMIIPILLGVFFNIYWMLTVNIVSSLICFLMNAYYSGPLLNYSIKEQIFDLLPSFVLASSVSIILFILDKYLVVLYPFLLLCIQFMFALLLLVVVCEKIKLEEYFEIKRILCFFLKKL